MCLSIPTMRLADTIVRDVIVENSVLLLTELATRLQEETDSNLMGLIVTMLYQVCFGRLSGCISTDMHHKKNISPSLSSFRVWFVLTLPFTALLLATWVSTFSNRHNHHPTTGQISYRGFTYHIRISNGNDVSGNALYV